MISDTEARRIASEWHGGGGTALYAFASTGAIDTARPDHDVLSECNQCIAHHLDTHDLYGLREYVTRHGTRGPQPGWAELTW